MAFPLWPTIFLFALALCFNYFVLAGGRTFSYGPGDEWAAGLAQFSFLMTGVFGTLFIGFRAAVPTANAIGSSALMVCALLLYDWARRTVRERGFPIAWTGEVPSALCEDGPYGLLRHPLYASYIVAFAAQFVALPRLATAAIFLFNLALFIHAARDDERALAVSDLAADYARYKERTGMFVPRLPRRRAV